MKNGTNSFFNECAKYYCYYTLLKLSTGSNICVGEKLLVFEENTTKK